MSLFFRVLHLNYKSIIIITQIFQYQTANLSILKGGFVAVWASVNSLSNLSHKNTASVVLDGILNNV